MANWCNIRLIVAGAKADLQRFSRLAQRKPLEIFRDDMLGGETVELNTRRMTKARRGWHLKRYYFQSRGDEGFDHFQKLAKRFPGLAFQVSYGDPNAGDAGTLYIGGGRRRRHILAGEAFLKFLKNHGLPCKGKHPDWEHPDAEEKFWEALWAAERYVESRFQELISRPPGGGKVRLKIRK